MTSYVLDACALVADHHELEIIEKKESLKFFWFRSNGNALRLNGSRLPVNGNALRLDRSVSLHYR